jgi:penicillin-binding protein-related factor A (putative recombinase)
MAKNEGKNFEAIIKSNAPSYLKLTRIPDPPQSFTQRSDTKFSKKNPYDFEAYDSLHRIQYSLELKSTSQKYLTYHTCKADEEDGKGAMIMWHQIEGLTKASEYDNCIAGFLMNFRLDNGEQLLYFMNIKDFNKFRKGANKKSLNILDISLSGGIKIYGEKLRKNYRWNLDEFLKSQSEVYPL